MYQPYRTRPAFALAPALSGADHLASIEVDVETAIAECPIHFPQGRDTAQLIQQLTNRLAESPVGGFDTVLVTFATRWRVDQRDVDGRCRLRYWLTAGFAQQHRPTRRRGHLARGFEPRQTIQSARHDQRLVTWLPEQQTKFRVTRAYMGQQVLFGKQAGFDG
ncbi:hypothetical protein D3C86_1311960 [compost metagenome]